MIPLDYHPDGSSINSNSWARLNQGLGIDQDTMDMARHSLQVLGTEEGQDVTRITQKWIGFLSGDFKGSLEILELIC